MIVDGCIESGQDVTEGGAEFNSSGVQGVGVADVADSLAALHALVFERKKYSLVQIIDAMRKNFNGNPKMRAEFLNAPKFGNDMELPDRYAGQVAKIYHDALSAYKNTPGRQLCAWVLFFHLSCGVRQPDRSTAVRPKKGRTLCRVTGLRQRPGPPGGDGFA